MSASDDNARDGGGADHMSGAVADAFALGMPELARLHGLNVGTIVGATTVDRFEARLMGDPAG